MVIAAVTPYTHSMDRVLAFIGGTLAPQVATSTIALDIAAVTRVADGDPYWRPRLICARRMLEQRRAAERQASVSCRADAEKRYLANRRARAEENRQRAKAGGSAKKQKK